MSFFQWQTRWVAWSYWGDRATGVMDGGIYYRRVWRGLYVRSELKFQFSRKGGLGIMQEWKIDADEVKRRVTLRSVLERDGVVLRRAGGSWVACCPVHDERTPSFHLHEAEGGDWFRCFGCGIKGDLFAYMKVAHGLEFAEAVKSLGEMAGLGGGFAMPAPLPPRAPMPEEKPAEPLDAAGLKEWDGICEELYGSICEVHRWAKWRGIRVEVIDWAARAGLCGRVIYRGEWREAFLIRRVTADGAMEDMGWHVRLGPRTAGNEKSDKASWRYVPAGIGAWPFVVLPVGGIEFARYVFVCEGQWDALALIDLMGWEARWPNEVAVFGMRGATSVQRVMDYRLRNDATVFLIADMDAAGMKWFRNPDGDSFSKMLEKRVRRVYGFGHRGAKDLNDAIKGMDEKGRALVRYRLRSMIARKKGIVPKKVTFFRWATRQKEREDLVGEFAREICVKGALTPKGRAQKKVWLRYMRAFPDFVEGFKVAWGEWEAVK